LHYFAVKFFAPLSFMLWIHDGVVSVYPHDYRNGSEMVAGTLAIKLHSWSQINPIVTHKITNVKFLIFILYKVVFYSFFPNKFTAKWQSLFTMGATTG